MIEVHVDSVTSEKSVRVVESCHEDCTCPGTVGWDLLTVGNHQVLSSDSPETIQQVLAPLFKAGAPFCIKFTKLFEEKKKIATLFSSVASLSSLNTTTSSNNKKKKEGRTKEEQRRRGRKEKQKVQKMFPKSLPSVLCSKHSIRLEVVERGMEQEVEQEIQRVKNNHLMLWI